jgi:soluble lytic murein transglycosylase-like protein
VLSSAERDSALARVAAGWFYYGRADRAFELAAPAAARSGRHVPHAHWIAGLAAWKLGQPDAAVPQFQNLYASPRATPELKAAGAYWAARGLLRLRRPAEHSLWLRRAAAHSRSFYGLIAQEALGLVAQPAFRARAVSEPVPGALARQPAVRRALALLQVGERTRARAALMGAPGWERPETAAALLTLAERGGLSGLVFRLGHRLAADPDHRWPAAAVNAALYPIPPWRPATGFRIDRALLYAFMRQESGFDPRATSHAGARGLLQLMPATASYMARRENFRYSGRSELYRPDLNLDLAQRYLAYLSNYDWVGDNLVHIAAAYNGGPGNLQTWQRHVDSDDPLLFVESLPSFETRSFVERVLSNLWIYRKRLGQPAPSLTAIAAGRWPRYHSLDADRQEIAQR